ncbi:MAG: hypothetical protein AAFP99_08245 [Pseudomonadota bacterium]
MDRRLFSSLATVLFAFLLLGSASPALANSVQIPGCSFAFSAPSILQPSHLSELYRDTERTVFGWSSTHPYEEDDGPLRMTAECTRLDREFELSMSKPLEGRCELFEEMQRAGAIDRAGFCQYGRRFGHAYRMFVMPRHDGGPDAHTLVAVSRRDVLYLTFYPLALTSKRGIADFLTVFSSLRTAAPLSRPKPPQPVVPAVNNAPLVTDMAPELLPIPVKRPEL